MTQMTPSADKVALVQTALSLPVMLIALPAGAIADTYDRRIVALIALSIALSGATRLTALEWFGLTTQNLLLLLRNAAYELHDERLVGSLEVGKLADFIVVDQNVATTAPDKIAATKVARTVVGGRIVYDDGEFAKHP